MLGIIWAYQSSRPGLESMYSHLAIDIGTAYYVTSLGVNVVLTTLIILRLVHLRTVVLKILPADYTKHYMSAVTIVVESVLVYSIFALAFIITYALDNPMNQVFLYMGSGCQVRISWLSYKEVNIAFAANCRIYDYIESCPRTGVDVRYGNNFIQMPCQYTIGASSCHSGHHWIAARSLLRQAFDSKTRCSGPNVSIFVFCGPH